MGQAISKLTIKGYKSIRSLENFELRNINILIGPNGAGKSNFVDFFRLLQAMMEGNLAFHVMKHGGCDDFLFNGPKHTTRIETELKFPEYFVYSCSLLPTVDEKFIIEREGFGAHKFLGGFESNLIDVKNDETSIERKDDE
ncbi:MAG: AAA family ATPase, partial [Planctomycetota bacterium]|nr:AAA family ATPase [Planctomycetota bacterium]